ncbi:hypothetical protein RRF57_007713 [Xylaria bambusicola]|uniref:Uncharacterized protein n=1 Tax=Xylaria bambusicola TaxID=326684 RepID=A0AAN7V0X5_9PEZI
MSSTRLRRSPDDRNDRIGGIEAPVADPPVLVRGLYDIGGFLDIETLLSSDAVLCNDLGSKSSRWPEKLPLVVASAGNPPATASMSCSDGVLGDAEVGARLFRTVLTVSEEPEGDLTPVVFGRALAVSSDVDRFKLVEAVVAGREADSGWKVDARDLTASNCVDGGGRETMLSTSQDLRFLELGFWAARVSEVLGGEE